MVKVELFVDENREGVRYAAFSRNNPFILADDPENKSADTPSNAEYARLFAEQADRWGWPVTFPEPKETDGEMLYPVLQFGTNNRDGTVIYAVMDWQSLSPSQPTEPESPEMAGTPEVISPAPSPKRGKSKE